MGSGCRLTPRRGATVTVGLTSALVPAVFRRGEPVVGGRPGLGGAMRRAAHLPAAGHGGAVGGLSC